MGKKTPKAPAAPDYSKLAQDQAVLDNAALDKQNAYNTVNQDTAYGSQQYTINPDGTRNLKTTLNPADQARLDQQRTMAGGLLGQAANNYSKPMDTSGLPAWGSYDQGALTQTDLSKLGQGQQNIDLTQMGKGQQNINTSNLNQGLQQVDLSNLSQGTTPIDIAGMKKGLQTVNPGALQNGVPGMGSLASNHYGMDPTGNSQAIQDATYKLLQPQREEARKAREQELANQGLRPGMPGYDRAMTRMDQGDTDAQLKSLLAGQQEYGQAFNRGLSQNQNNFGQDSTVANFQNQSNAQRFGQNSEQQRLALALRGQQFGENSDMARLGLSQNDQQFGQNADTARLQMGLNNQQFGQNADMARLGMSRNDQLWGQGTDYAKMGLATNDQLWGQGTDAANLGMAQSDQQWGRQNDILNMNASQRAAMLGEQNMLRQQPMQELQGLLGTMPTDPNFGSYSSSAGSASPDMMGAADKSYAAAMNNFNAANARKSNLTGGLFGLAGSALGGPMGGMAGKAIGSLF